MTSLEDGGRPSTHGPGYSCEAFSKSMKATLSENANFLVSVIPNCFSPHFHRRAIDNVNEAPTVEGAGGRMNSFVRCASSTSRKEPVPSKFRGGKSIIYEGRCANDVEFDYLKCAKFYMFYCQTYALLVESLGEYCFVPFDCKDVHILAALIARSCYAKHSDYSATLVRRIHEKGGIPSLTLGNVEELTHGGLLVDSSDEEDEEERSTSADAASGLVVAGGVSTPSAMIP